MLQNSVPLRPKDAGGKLNIVAIGRISTVHQDHENIEASYRYIREHLGRIYDGPMDLKLLGEQASGMLTDRATIREAEELIASGKVDVIIAEDLARVYRNPRHQYDFVQNAVDVGTRVICPGDNLDTADENWEISMGAAALRHGLSIPDTRRRVRRTATHCFHKGGMVQKIRYGYRKLTKEQAESGQFGPKGLRIARVPECTPIIRAIKDRVLRGDKYAVVAEWLEAERVNPGPYVETGRWTGRLVVDLLDDPILSGTRIFRDTICRPIFRTGKHKATKNAEPETEYYPELVHLSREEHEVLRAEIARRRAEHAAKKPPRHNRHNTPRSRSIWPGQAAACAVCGGLMYYMGTHLKCKNSLPGLGGECWNHVQVSAELTRQRVLSWLMDRLDCNSQERQVVVDAVWQLLEPTWRRAARGPEELDREIKALERRAANLSEAIAEGGELKTLVAKLRSVEDAIKTARKRKAAQLRRSRDGVSYFSKGHVERNLAMTLRQMLGESFEFADLMRRNFPEFVIQPVQALDSGLVRPRAKFTFRVRAVASAAGTSHGQPPEIEDVHAAVDLFEPPVHIRHLPRCLAARKENPHLSLKRIANGLGINRMTVKRAMDYARLMEAHGMSEPYRELHACPKQASRWRAHRRAQ